MDNTLTLFSQFGLPGVVIGALFLSLWLLIRELRAMSTWHDSRIDATVEKHSEERECWLNAYRDNTEVLRRFLEKK